MTVFTCDSNIESIFTCIYDAGVWALQYGHENLRLEREPILQSSLFDTYVHVEPDREKAEKVARSIRNKISFQAYIHIFYGCLYAEDVLDSMYQYLRIGFRVGKNIEHMLTEPAVMRMMEVRRRVGNEIHYFREFVRFQCIDEKVLVSHIEPKNNVLYEVARHFSDRMPSEYWILVDDRRKIAVVHEPKEEMYIQQLEEEQYKKLRQTEKVQDEFTELWKLFFDTIGIKERENRTCQRNLFPNWMRKHVTEFMEGKIDE